MPKPKASAPAPPPHLPVEALRRRCDPEAIPFATTAEAEELDEIVGQDRAVEAVRFGIAMHRHGYNIFAAGPPGTGKQTLVRQFLDRRAADEPTPPDWCYVQDFSDPRRPRALELPPGEGAKLRADMERLVGQLRVALPAAFDSDEYRTRKQQLVRVLNERRELAFASVQRRAREHDVAVVQTDTGVLVAPAREGSVLEPDAFRKLPEEERRRLEGSLEKAREDLAELFRSVHEWEHEHREATRALDRDMATTVVQRSVEQVRERWGRQANVVAYLGEVESDVIANVGDFVAPGESGIENVLQRALARGQADGSSLKRYEVNVLVDHSRTRGAPVVVEDHPTLADLVGRTEHTAQFGALVTDFTLIRPGALHRANGGYLLIDAIELLRQPGTWDALKLALRRREVRIESLGQQMALVSTVSLEPEPIPIQNLRIVLVGERSLYYALAALDAEFLEMFKVVADFEEGLDRDPDSEVRYARLVATIARREGMRPLDRGAVAAVLEQASRLAGDAGKLSVRMRPVVDLLSEADFRAASAGRDVTSRADVEEAIAAQLRRSGRIRDRLLEAVRRDILRVETTEARAGQINGLSVMRLAEIEYGHPVRITARVRAGKGEVVDIEREVELGGPLHSKGVLILSGFLSGRYAPDRPLSLAASLVFEQSYGPVDGDSASLAELCSLLSALSGVPIRQSLAVTGSVDQTGRVQAIGGVNEKIEGFFDVCNDRGLTGDQGVLIPASNAQHLMLRQDVVDGVAAGRFRVWTVATVDEALELLTGVAAGVANERGEFPADSVNGRAEARLAALATSSRAREGDAGPG
jgi:lon-related putative ATP-dependent protease